MAEAFWRFSLVLYSRSGVAEALLRLQGRDGYNVNLILFALWCGAVLRHALDAAELSAAEAAAAPLEQTTVLVRELRRRLKTAAGAPLRDLRRRCVMLELAAERAVQYRLAETVASEPEAADGFALAAANLTLYLGPERAGGAEAAGLREALAGLLRR